MTRSQRIGIQVIDFVRMEDARFPTRQDGLLPRRIRQPVHSPVPAIGSVPFAGRTHDRHALLEHHLISTVCVQVSRAHEACLRRMRVDPADDHEVREGVDKVEQGRFTVWRHLAGIRGGCLSWEDEFADEESVGYQSPGKEGTRLQITIGIGRSEGEKG